MRKTVLSPLSSPLPQTYTLSDWWLFLLTGILTFFSFLFLLPNYWIDSNRLHDKFVHTSVATANTISKKIEEKIALEQSPLQYLARDSEILHAVALDSTPQVKTWLKKLQAASINQLIYIYSIPYNKVYTLGSAHFSIKGMPRRTPATPEFSIYKTKDHHYLLNIMHPLRLNNQMIGTIGCVIPMESFIANLGTTSIPYALLIKENDTLHDTVTGEQVEGAVPLVDITDTSNPLIPFSEVRVVTPLSVDGFLLLTQSQNIGPHLFSSFLKWLFVCIPASIILFLLCRHIIMRKISIEFADLTLTGDPFTDKKRLIHTSSLVKIKEFQDSARMMTNYLDEHIKSERQRRHTALFEESDSALAICDLEGNIMEWNKNLAEFLGINTPQKLYNTPVKEIFIAPDQLTVVTGMAHVRHCSETTMAEHGIFKARLRLNSTRKRYQHVETTIKRVRGPHFDTLVFMLHNITHQVSTERGLTIAKQGAETSVLEHHKFYMGITEELQPLSEALRRSIIMLTETETSETQERHLDALQIHSTLLAELIRNIREFAQLETGEVFFDRSRFEMESLLKQLHAATYSRTMQLGVDFSIYLDPHLPQLIWFDFPKSLQVLSNLVSLAAKKVQGGSIILMAKAQGGRKNRVFGAFELYGLTAKDHISPSEQEKNSFPQIEYYGEKGQALNFAIAQRMVKLYSLNLQEQSTASGTYHASIRTDIPRLTPERSKMEQILSGKTILLTYCTHNTMSNLAKALSGLGAICTFQPITEDYCQRVIAAQQDYDLVLNCGCSLEILPDEHMKPYCDQLTRRLITINHSYWEPTLKHPKITLLRKPLLINELLLIASEELMPNVQSYTVTDYACNPDTILLVGEETTQRSWIAEGMSGSGYAIHAVDDVTEAVEAMHTFRPETVVINTENITLDAYWLVWEIRRQEAEHNRLPVRIIILSGPDTSIATTVLDSHTLLVNHLSTNTELIHHILTLRQRISTVGVA
ncbi:MAG: PAS domain S-box protein [Desulfovibrionales bacterium]|nr:PAS domain S-box protein [Desulfovibrionales bacterium]